jgi:hypothetical protein
VFVSWRPADLWHVTALLIFVGLMWLLAARHMRRRLID